MRQTAVTSNHRPAAPRATLHQQLEQRTCDATILQLERELYGTTNRETHNLCRSTNVVNPQPSRDPEDLAHSKVQGRTMFRTLVQQTRP